MPIYHYACSKCHHEEEHLQKISDPVLIQCPRCKESSYKKQVTSAAFQLKGSGWYVSDFKSKSNQLPQENSHTCSTQCSH